MRLILVVGLVLSFACGPPSHRLGQKIADYIAVFPNETDRLRLIVSKNSLTLSGYLEASIKRPNGTVKVLHTEITGDVSTSGVPATITIPSSVLGVPDLTLGCLFDRSLNLEVFGDNRVRFPRRWRRVR
jgi:hypothetical protein